MTPDPVATAARDLVEALRAEPHLHSILSWEPAKRLVEALEGKEGTLQDARRLETALEAGVDTREEGRD